MKMRTNIIILFAAIAAAGMFATGCKGKKNMQENCYDRYTETY